MRIKRLFQRHDLAQRQRILAFLNLKAMCTLLPACAVPLQKTLCAETGKTGYPSLFEAEAARHRLNHLKLLKPAKRQRLKRVPYLRLSRSYSCPCCCQWHHSSKTVQQYWDRRKGWANHHLLLPELEKTGWEGHLWKSDSLPFAPWIPVQTP